MAININDKWGKVSRTQPIGDRLYEEFFAKDGTGAYISYTGYTFTASLYDSFDNVVATPTVTIATATPPSETSAVTDGRVTISAAPASLPTKEGEYTLWVTKTNDGDATDVETFIEVQISFITKKYRR